MTELQIGLLIIGAVLVAGVFAFNRLQERKARRAAARAFRASAGDALLQEAQPAAGAAVPGRPPGEAPAGNAPAGELPDARIDYLVELTLPLPVPIDRLRDAWRPHEHRYARRALLAWAAQDGQWQSLAPGDGRAALGLRAGLQLVSRDGAIGEAELIEFRTAIETMAAGIGGSVSAPEMRLEVERARELDAFCADAEIQVVLHVVPGTDAALDALRLREIASGQGLSPGADGRLAMLDAAGRVKFVLGGRDGGAIAAGGNAIAGASLALEVARVADPCACFRAMAACGRELAAALGGALADDNGRTLDDRALAAIEAQLGTVQSAFAAQGIEPGSGLAARLFA